MPESKVPLKNPWLAALLAYLIPGAGHLYQGRVFKGLLYFVCIVGTFLYGMKLGDWKVVYYRGDLPLLKAANLGYLAQALVGLPALPALVQSKRYFDPGNRPPTSLDGPLSAPFTGAIVDDDIDGQTVVGRLRGRIVLKPVGVDVEGTFTGTLDGKQQVQLHLAGLRLLERKIAGDPGREVRCHIDDPPQGQSEFAGQQIRGKIPRSFWNWFEVPLEGALLEKLHRRLGKFYELAVVFTWIAGLLNILAIWDALEGPAYGYGDEEEDEEEKKTSRKAKDGQADSSQQKETPGETKPAAKPLAETSTGS